MPNLIMEYSEPVAEQVNIPALLDDLHQVSLNSGVFAGDDVKSRAYACQHWQIGHTEDSQDFIHITFTLLSGRDEATKKELGAQLMSVLRDRASSVHSLTIEMRDMERETFTKVLQ
ncbi:5-carboxymethyl-2-hydroxymuconate Delta-isomerase [Thaumasiovibrio subtropicus]|uniref:5-carboxymethyl-2-hydroxymuconate Delta-isomerase n=1 Tax=Thaumasiovibrio subtropicus TaxID=1891207 RepID=UPI000B3527C2|nr:5-carboxymethyl-2-hydroxymuconate Delta-isomerase [Thaumasiovibrio subtropicus]